MKRRYFHGTTIENFKNMIASNFSITKNFIWSCSDDEYLYLYDLKKYHELEHDNDINELNYSVKRCIESALESAQIAASVQNTKNSELVVIEFSIDENLIEDDLSCENMGLASCINLSDLSLKDIKNVYICEDGYVPSVRLLYVLGIFNNDYFVLENYSEIEQKMLDVLSQQDLYFYEELTDFEYKKMDCWNNQIK